MGQLKKWNTIVTFLNKSFFDSSKVQIL